MSLKDCRRAAGLSQAQLAERVEGLSLRTLQHYEQGDLEVRKASAEIALRIAKALNCKIEDLF